MTPPSDIVEEAGRVVAAATDAGVPVRVLGGVAVRMHTAAPLPQLEREFKDIDVVARPSDSRRVQTVLEGLGYAGDPQFNAMNAGRRGLYFDVPNQRRLDVFMGDFEMCHRIPLMDRLTVDPVTLPLAELLLTKLQVVELNRRDEVDILQLLIDHAVGSGDDETINADLVAALCAGDWGLWRTTKLNVGRVHEALDGYGFAGAERDVVARRLDALWARIEAEPKSSRWKLRDRVGDRKRWYEKPEETD